jgi:hypothetical protein
MGMGTTELALSQATCWPVEEESTRIAYFRCTKFFISFSYRQKGNSELDNVDIPDSSGQTEATNNLQDVREVLGVDRMLTTFYF